MWTPFGLSFVLNIYFLVVLVYWKFKGVDPSTSEKFCLPWHSSITFLHDACFQTGRSEP